MHVSKRKKGKLSTSKHVCASWTLKLKLHAVAKNPTENVKEKSIEVCQNILSDGQNVHQTVIDVAHCLGKSSSNHSTPRPIIIRFSLRSYRDAVWKSAKNHPDMRDNKLRFAEDLSQLVRGQAEDVALDKKGTKLR